MSGFELIKHGFDKDNIISNIKNIDFPVVIKELRKALFKAMSKEEQEEYLRHMEIILML